MAELNPFEQKIVEVMKSLGATSEDKVVTMDRIMRTAGLPKGKVANILQSLIGKGIVKRIARQKAAGYYLVKS